MGCLAVGQARGWQAQGARLGANLPPPPPSARCGILPARSRVTSRARAAERAGHHQRWENTRAWVDGGRGVKGVSSHLTAPLASTSRQLYSASLLLLAPNAGKPRRVRESLWRDWGRELAPSEGLVQRRAPAPTPVPPSPPPPTPLLPLAPSRTAPAPPAPGLAHAR